MALTRARIEEATEVLKRTVADLRLQGVRSFKGDLLDAHGAKLWSLDITFERDGVKKREG